MMTMNPATPTVDSRDSSSAVRPADMCQPGACALRRESDDSAIHGWVSARRMRYRAIMLSAVLMCMLLVMHPPLATADEDPCVAWIHQMEPGMIRIRGGDGVRMERVDSSRLPTPLCVLEIVAEKPRYKVYVKDGELKGEWLIKRRKVSEIVGAVEVDCSAAIVTAKVKIKDKRTGGVRAIGEEPCE